MAECRCINSVRVSLPEIYCRDFGLYTKMLPLIVALSLTFYVLPFPTRTGTNEIETMNVVRFSIVLLQNNEKTM